GIARPGVHAQLSGARDASWIEIEAEDLAAGGAQQLDGDLADETKAEHGDAVAELRRRAAHALERDRSDRRGCRRAARTASRPAAYELALHADEVRVVGLAGPGAGHEIARRQIRDAGANGDHFAGDRVAHTPPLLVELTVRQAAGCRWRHRHFDRFELDARL